MERKDRPLGGKKERDRMKVRTEDRERQLEKETRRASHSTTFQQERPLPLYLLPDKAPEAYQPMGNFN